MPQLIRLVGNDGMVDVPYVKAASGLAGYFDAVPNANQRYKIEIEPNMTFAAGSAPRIPAELWRFLQPAKLSPFPLGSQRAVDLGVSPPGHPIAAKYTYAIPQDVSTFTGILTISANPLWVGGPYRSSRTYLVTLVTGYESGSAHDYLIISPLLLAHAPNVSYPMAASIYFGSTDTPPPDGAKRLHTLGGSFTVRVANGSGYQLEGGKTFVSLEVRNIGY